MDPLRQQFIEFALQAGVLRFGEFITKAAARPPTFQRRPLQPRCAACKLARFYGQTLLAAESSGVSASTCCSARRYKGITLAAATAVALAESGAMCRSRSTARKPKITAKEAALSALSLTGRVVILDDVITAGTSVRESVDLIKAGGATLPEC